MGIGDVNLIAKIAPYNGAFTRLADADNIYIDDIGGYFVSDYIEGALQEIGLSIVNVTLWDRTSTALGDTLVPHNSGDAVRADSGLVIGIGGAGLDYSLIFDGESSDCVITYYEDETILSISQNVLIPDNKYLYLGSGIDFYAYHNGTNTYLRNSTGNLYIQNWAQDADLIFGINDGSSYNNLITIDGDVSIVRFNNDNGITIGGGNDLSVYMSSDNAYIKNNTNNKDLHLGVTGTGHVYSDNNFHVGGDCSETSLFGETMDKKFFVKSTTASDGFALEQVDNGVTGPLFALLHNSASPAQGDEVGRWKVYGKDSGDNWVIYGQMDVMIGDPTDSASNGIFKFEVQDGGSLALGFAVNMIDAVNMVYSHRAFGTIDRDAYFISKRIGEYGETSEGNGYDVYVQAADGVADVSPDYDGGDVIINGGAKAGSGNNGNVKLCTSRGSAFIGTIKSGATQVAAGAIAGEIWKTASHALLPDNVLMIGV